MYVPLSINTRVLFVGMLLTLFTPLVFAPRAYAQDAPEGRPVPSTPAISQPSTASLSTEGIFGCLGQGARVANVGTLSAIGGVYVPVNDAAVTLNTGYLVYKECLLDGVSRRVAENASTELGKQVIRGTATGGPNGGTQWSGIRRKEFKDQAIAVVVSELEDDAEFAPVCEAFKNPVRRALVRNYARALGDAPTSVTCPFTTSATNPGSFYDQWFALIEPTGNALGTYLVKQAEIDAEVAAQNQDTREILLASNNIYPTFDSERDPRKQRILTPGYLIASTLAQVSGSGFRQIETANEIDQMVKSMWGAFGTFITTDTQGGLLGAALPRNGQPAYIDRMAAESSAGLRESAVNVALSILGAARQIEALYKQAKEATANALSAAIQELRSMENRCWALVVPKVQEKAASEGKQLRIATTTAFSQQIIDSQIAPLATTTLRDLNASTAILAIISQLIASVSNSASATNQRTALERLDAMVANSQLHSAQQAQNASKQKDDITAALATLISDTRVAWGDSTDPEVGWCNINNEAVITRWFNAWKI